MSSANPFWKCLWHKAMSARNPANQGANSEGETDLGYGQDNGAS